jgi:hypothetical protein
MGRSKRMLRKYYSGKGSGDNILSTEFLKKNFLEDVHAFKFPFRS